MFERFSYHGLNQTEFRVNFIRACLKFGNIQPTRDHVFHFVGAFQKLGGRLFTLWVLNRFDQAFCRHAHPGERRFKFMGSDSDQFIL